MVAVVGIFDAHPPLGPNASAGAAELIRQAIVDGRVVPGQRLKEEELAQQLGISRTPVREALLVLQTEGLVEASPNRGRNRPLVRALGPGGHVRVARAARG